MAFGAGKPIFHLFSWHRVTILRKFKAGVEKIWATVKQFWGWKMGNFKQLEAGQKSVAYKKLLWKVYCEKFQLVSMTFILSWARDEESFKKMWQN